MVVFSVGILNSCPQHHELADPVGDMPVIHHYILIDHNRPVSPMAEPVVTV